MKRYYLITFSWSVHNLSKVEDCKVFTNMEDPLREHFIREAAHTNTKPDDALISKQRVEISRNESSTTFKCEDGLFRVVVTSEYPEKSKSWKHNSHKLIDVLCEAIIKEERNYKINDILN